MRERGEGGGRGRGGKEETGGVRARVRKGGKMGTFNMFISYFSLFIYLVFSFGRGKYHRYFEFS